jgi:hypothetical protein
VKERGATPDAEARLRGTIATLKKTIASKNKELDQFRADVPALVRTVNQLPCGDLGGRVVVPVVPGS